MIEDKNYAQQLLHTIKDSKIQPKARWQFLLTDYALWLSGGLLLLFSSISVASILYGFNDGLAGYNDMTGNVINRLLAVFPFFWLVCFLIFVAIVYYNLKHTKLGYRFSTWLTISIVLTVSIVLGLVFNLAGTSKNVDDFLGRRAPLYDKLVNPRINYWSMVREGRLIGIIVERNISKEFKLIDPRGESWQIIMNTDTKPNFMILRVGEVARFNGVVVGDHLFLVNRILPPDLVGQDFFKRFNGQVPRPPNN